MLINSKKLKDPYAHFKVEVLFLLKEVLQKEDYMQNRNLKDRFVCLINHFSGQYISEGSLDRGTNAGQVHSNFSTLELKLSNQHKTIDPPTKLENQNSRN